MFFFLRRLFYHKCRVAKIPRVYDPLPVMLAKELAKCLKGPPEESSDEEEESEDDEVRYLPALLALLALSSLSLPTFQPRQKWANPRRPPPALSIFPRLAKLAPPRRPVSPGGRG